MIVTNNSYLILGINTDANDKLVNKRLKEMENLLLIDEAPSYPSDIFFVDYKKVRTINSIKEAYHNLIDQKNKILQVFFWFDLADGKDYELFAKYQNGRVQEALNGWISEYTIMNNYHYLKNYVVAGLLVLEHQNISYGFADIINLREHRLDSFILLYNSDKFWSSFRNRINNQNDIKISKDKIESFKKEILQYLIDFLHNIGETDFYKKLVKTYGVAASNIDEDKTVIKEINNIKKFQKKLSLFNLKTEVLNIKNTIELIQDSFNILSNLGVENKKDILKLKDEIAESILDIAIKLHNEYDNIDDAEDLINIAENMASSTLLKERINDNKKTADYNFKQVEADNFIESIYLTIGDIENSQSQLEFEEILHKISNINTMMKRIEDGGNITKDKTDKIRNDAAYAIHKCGITFNNKFKDPVRSEKLLRMARKFTRSLEHKQVLDKEISTAQNNIRNKSTGCLSVLIIIIILTTSVLTYTNI